MSNKIDTENIGGVLYPVGTVKQHKFDTNQSRYNVVLNSGVILEYPEQQSNASVKSYEHGLFSTCNHTIINGMKGGKITGSDKDDKISLNFCSDLDVNVSNDPRDLLGGDTVTVRNSNNEEANIKVSVNEKDDEIILHKDNKIIKKENMFRNQENGKFFYVM